MSFTKSWTHEWIGKQVFIYLTHTRVYNGILKEYSETHVKINNVYFNPDHIISISLVEVRCLTS
jgi:hypothetical protein